MKIDTSFPEEIFAGNIMKLPQFKVLEQNLNRIAKEETKVMFCAIVNNEENLELNLNRMLSTASYFLDYKAMIVEYNSDDNTKKILDRYKDDKIEVVNLKLDKIDEYKDENKFMRFSQAAEVRNHYMDLLVSKHHEEYQATIILDLNLSGGWSYGGILDNTIQLLNNSSLTGCAGFSSYGIITDKENWKNIRLEERTQADYLMFNVDSFRENGHAKSEVNEKKEQGVTKNQQLSYINVKRPSKNIKVGSCFGGLCIYKSKCIQNIRYKSQEHETDLADSEHVCFHRSLRAKSKYLMLSNRLISSYSPHRFTK